MNHPPKKMRVTGWPSPDTDQEKRSRRSNRWIRLDILSGRAEVDTSCLTSSIPRGFEMTTPFTDRLGGAVRIGLVTLASAALINVLALAGGSQVVDSAWPRVR